MARVIISLHEYIADIIPNLIPASMIMRFYANASFYGDSFNLVALQHLWRTIMTSANSGLHGPRCFKCNMTLWSLLPELEITPT